jgi:hypothetical protein
VDEPNAGELARLILAGIKRARLGPQFEKVVAIRKPERVGR